MADPNPADSSRRTHDDRVNVSVPRNMGGAAVLTVSSSASTGIEPDTTGPEIHRRLQKWGFAVVMTEVVTDDRAAIATVLRGWADDPRIVLVLTTGGTGLSPTDVTPEATRDVMEREAAGIAELLRAAGLSSTPLAALSRGVAGVAGHTLIINLPGSRSGVRDGLKTLQPIIVHAVEIVSGP